ncbi:MAG: hypothetical protein QF890_09385 [Myxococcota bacterium]|nr:hypothetical protein [Deltaproteobacteria bacterium]MDP7076304.1 hypothetical protein [Myxococcota bacterium]MDP7432768.1 hypothetical protein [Myxococcota bacterium]HJO25439.1 hypothetical protein [Myxococcota bacterium]
MFLQLLRICLPTAVLLGAAPVKAMPLISEIFYDAAGADGGHVFVEIWGTAGTALSGLVLEGVNGSNGSITHTLALSGTIPGDGLFVVASDRGDGASDVPEADLVLAFDFQNGPDSVVLRGVDGVLDAVGYGVFGPGQVFAGEGFPAADAAAGESLARHFANRDTDHNALDFGVLAAATPGTAPLMLLPEPGSLVLCMAGLAGLAVFGRRVG